MIALLTIDDIKTVAHALAEATMSWSEPIPPFRTRYPDRSDPSGCPRGLDDGAVFGKWLVAYGKWFDHLPYHRQTVFWHEMKVISRGDINLC